MRKEKITLEKHIKMANDMAIACHYLTKVMNRCSKYYPKTKRIMKALKKLSPTEEGSCFREVQETLTAEFHTTARKKDFKPEEEIYKNLDKRFKNLSHGGE